VVADRQGREHQAGMNVPAVPKQRTMRGKP
jgi:hypothetical protein